MIPARLFMTCMVLFTTSAFSHHQAETRRFESVSISSGFSLEAGEQKLVTMKDWRYVKNITVNAIARGTQTWTGVYVNGDIKGNFVVPVKDPHFLVTIGETTQSILVRNEGGGRLVISGIQASVGLQRVDIEAEFSDESRYEFNLEAGIYPELDKLFEENKATTLARAAQLIVMHMQKYTDPAKEYVPYLLPIKLAAARARYMANARGVLGQKIRPALKRLVVQMASAKPLTNALLRKEGTFEITVRFLALKEKIKDLLD